MYLSKVKLLNKNTFNKHISITYVVNLISNDYMHKILIMTKEIFYNL